MASIRVLPEHLINQIAAGEVVERPASVVKELVENALDAGAGVIAIDVAGGGRSRIRVADDGCGMSRDDALLSLQRHATSKLCVESDLRRIRTLGFRGEALPAIASVARLTLLTSPDGASGTRVDVEGGTVSGVSAVGHPRGTTLDVRDLFFNTPARAKFLKSSSTEVGHIADAVAGLAAALPAVKITLMHEGRLLIDAPRGAGIQERLCQLDGASWRDAMEFDASSGGVRVHGFLALRPAGTAVGRRTQRIHVNGRVVRDRLIAHAIIAACEAFLPKGRHPGTALFIECPSEAVDVNVHPAKAEVRFRDPRMVHDLVQETIVAVLRETLPVTPMVPTIPGARDGALSAEVHEATRRYAAQAQPDRETGGGARDRRFGPYRGHAGDLAGAPGAGAPAQAVPRADLPVAALFPGAVPLAHYRQSYSVAQDEEGLLLIDQHAAHERILFEQLVAASRGESERQELLFPVTIVPPRRLGERLFDLAAELTALGFAAEPFGDGTLVVRGAPASLDIGDPTPLIEDLLDAMDDADPPAGDTLSRRERLLATVACHAAIKVRMALTMEKMNYLISALFRTQTPLKCPHGRPAVVRFSQRQIERSFDRP